MGPFLWLILFPLSISSSSRILWYEGKDLQNGVLAWWLFSLSVKMSSFPFSLLGYFWFIFQFWLKENENRWWVWLSCSSFSIFSHICVLECEDSLWSDIYSIMMGFFVFNQEFVIMGSVVFKYFFLFYLVSHLIRKKIRMRHVWAIHSCFWV